MAAYQFEVLERGTDTLIGFNPTIEEFSVFDPMSFQCPE